MKTEEEIEQLLRNLEADDRIQKYPMANVLTNAPLALIQVHRKAQAQILRTILDMPQVTYPTETE